MDWYKKEYYLLEDARKNPMGPSEMEADDVQLGSQTGKARLLRGGAWDNNFSNCHAALRLRGDPSFRNSNIGFRVELSRRP
ncbi:MAG: hypothetical protein GXP25_00965 [Planctomycetes bacterium]|nr:hypothetical protein [Planctomycetota bacterium]